jgi:nucleotide-binding universal stress UspA family protein
MYKRILCPIDGSVTSNRGLQEAIRLAKNQHAKLRFIHVIDNYVPIMEAEDGLMAVNVSAELKKNATNVINNATLMANSAGVEADAVIAEIFGGRPAKEMIKQAESWPADIIVMGTHGLRGFSRIILGSDAEHVVQASAVPVMLVNAGEHVSKR